MKLSYYRSPVPNFGDDLNAFLWKSLLPAGFLDEDERDLFVGVGSILYDKYPKTSVKHVFGSGFGGYHPPPDMKDGSWNPVFVRGPRSAARLGLSPETAICDGAILLRTLQLPSPGANTGYVGFMPHFQSLQWGLWPQVCELAGIRLIDPRGDTGTVLGELRGARVLIAEAMHGAIVADALRVPWIPVLPIRRQHHMKWLDWADSLELQLQQHKLFASSIREALRGLELAKCERVLRMVNHGEVRQNPVDRFFVNRAAERLSTISKFAGTLSQDTILDNRTHRALGAIEQFVKSRPVRSASR